jgi:hypothetical protein
MAARAAAFLSFAARNPDRLVPARCRPFHHPSTREQIHGRKSRNQRVSDASGRNVLRAIVESGRKGHSGRRHQ